MKLFWVFLAVTLAPHAWYTCVASGYQAGISAELLQSCPTLCNPMNCSLPGSSVHGISQAKILEWVAISFSGESSWPRDWTSRVRLSATPSTIQSTEISRPEYWSGQPIPSPGDLPDPGIELGYPALQTDSLPTELSGEAPCIGRQVLYRWATRKAQKSHSFKIFL